MSLKELARSPLCGIQYLSAGYSNYFVEIKDKHFVHGQEGSHNFLNILNDFIMNSAGQIPPDLTVIA